MSELSKDEIARIKPLLGPAPVLSTENAAHFDMLFDSVIEAMGPRDVMEMIYIRRVVVEVWIIERYTRHATVAIERGYRQSLERQAVQARLDQARKTQTSSVQSHGKPADIAGLAALEDNYMSAASDIDKIFERKATEINHNAALQRSGDFQEQLDRLISSATRRLEIAVLHLESGRCGFGEQTRHVTEQKTKRIIDGQCTEVAPEKIESPSVVPESPVGQSTDDNSPPR